MTRFWFLNYVVNPFTKLVLRSPLHRVASGTVLVLTYRGKKSGKVYALPVEYAQIGQTIYIVPGMPEHKSWWRNLRGGAPVRLWVRGRELSARAEVVEDGRGGADLVDGLDAYFRKFPASAKMRGMARMDGQFDREQLRSAAQSMTIVRVSLVD